MLIRFIDFPPVAGPLSANWTRLASGMAKATRVAESAPFEDAQLNKSIVAQYKPNLQLTLKTTT
jgi:hypothetical protein